MKKLQEAIELQQQEQGQLKGALAMEAQNRGQMEQEHTSAMREQK